MNKGCELPRLTIQGHSSTRVNLNLTTEQLQHRESVDGGLLNGNVASHGGHSEQLAAVRRYGKRNSVIVARVAINKELFTHWFAHQFTHQPRFPHRSTRTEWLRDNFRCFKRAGVRQISGGCSRVGFTRNPSRGCSAAKRCTTCPVRATLSWR